MSDPVYIKPVMLITGTSKGIGKYLAHYYLNKGYIVIGCSRSACEIENDNYIHIIADISDEVEILNIFKIIRKDYKRLDVLINNAVVNITDISVALLPYKTIEYTFKVNLFAPILLCREAVKLMSRNNFGRIVNMGSMLSKHEIPGTALYSATKSSLITFTRILSKEVYSLGITANVLSPSAIKTELSENVKQDVLMEVLNRNAIKKYGDLIDVSNSIDYLIKEESKSVTGQVIFLGGA